MQLQKQPDLDLSPASLESPEPLELNLTVEPSETQVNLALEFAPQKSTVLPVRFILKTIAIITIASLILVGLSGIALIALAILFSETMDC